MAGGRGKPLVTHQLPQGGAPLPHNVLADLLATPRTPLPFR